MHGTCAKHSIVTAKLELEKEVNKQKDNGYKTVVLSTDLSSAYDTVDHRLLMCKLEHLGFRNKMYKLFCSRTVFPTSENLCRTRKTNKEDSAKISYSKSFHFPLLL